MLEIIKNEIKIDPKLRKKVDIACSFAKIKKDILNGSLIRLEPTNIAYVKPHVLVINDTSFLFFNNVDKFYINDLNTCYKFSELSLYLKKAK